MTHFTTALLLMTALLCRSTAGGETSPPALPAPPAGMVLLPEGVYEPLFKTEGTQTVATFYMDIYPVTNEQFLQFVTDVPRWRRSKIKPIFADEGYLKYWVDDLDLGPERDTLQKAPVVQISWFAARAYARWANKRLPTQAEWEYAAAASERYADGKEDPAHVRYILNWYSKPTPKPIPAVGSTFKNVYGIYDLHGLVWEWVSDYNTALVTGESRGDTGLERNLFCGSGSVGASDFNDYAAFMRYAYRSSLAATYTLKNIGFRCVRNVPQPEETP